MKTPREYPPLQRPFLEVATQFGPVHALALAWMHDQVQIRFPLMVWPDATPQFIHTSWVQAADCRPIREADVPWREHFIDRPWHDERDAKIAYRPDPSRAYPQRDGTLHRHWLALVHAERRRGGDESKVQVLAPYPVGSLM